MQLFSITAKYCLIDISTVLLTVVAFSCATKGQNPFPFRDKYVYTFETDSVNRNKIGLVRYDDGSVEFPNSIYHYDNYIYLLDQVHSNVKMIDIRNGKIKTSPLIPTKKYLNDLVVWKESVLVVGDTDTLYKLDLELQYVENLLPGMTPGLKRFLINEENLLVYRQHDDVHQNPVDHSVEIQVCLFVEGSCRTETIAVGKGYEEYFDLLKPYKPVENTNCFIASDSEHCLDNPIPDFDFYNLIRPVHVDKESVSFVERIGSKVRITCYIF